MEVAGKHCPFRAQYVKLGRSTPNEIIKTHGNCGFPIFHAWSDLGEYHVVFSEVRISILHLPKRARLMFSDLP